MVFLALAIIVLFASWASSGCPVRLPGGSLEAPCGTPGQSLDVLGGSSGCSEGGEIKIIKNNNPQRWFHQRGETKCSWSKHIVCSIYIHIYIYSWSLGSLIIESLLLLFLYRPQANFPSEHVQKHWNCTLFVLFVAFTAAAGVFFRVSIVRHNS